MAVARAHGLAVVEDDVHGLLPEERPRPIAALAPERSYYLTSTSKTLAPGLRIAYVAAPPAMVPRLAASLRATTWAVAPLTAAVASAWIRDGTADALLAARRQEARERQAIAGERLAGADLQTQPEAYYLWLRLPEPWRGDAFAAEARARGVLVTPAEAFAVGREAAPHAVRLCLGAARTQEALGRGLDVVAGLLRAEDAAGSAVVSEPRLEPSKATADLSRPECLSRGVAPQRSRSLRPLRPRPRWGGRRRRGSAGA